MPRQNHTNCMNREQLGKEVRDRRSGFTGRVTRSDYGNGRYEVTAPDGTTRTVEGPQLHEVGGEAVTQQGGATVEQWEAWWAQARPVEPLTPAELIDLLQERLREEPLRDALGRLPGGGNAA